MKPRELIKESVKRGINLVCDVRMVRDRQHAALVERINQDAAKARQRQEDQRKQRLEAEHPQIETLRRFAGRLVIVTNPQGRLYVRDSADQRAKDEFTEAITGVFESGRPVAVTTHASIDRVDEGIQRDLDDVISVLRQPLASRGIDLCRPAETNHPSGVYATDNNYQLWEGLAAAAHDTAESVQDGVPLQGIIAVVSALGVSSVNLSYSDARYGNAYVLQGIDNEHRFAWKQIFNTNEVRHDLAD